MWATISYTSPFARYRAETKCYRQTDRQTDGRTLSIVKLLSSSQLKSSIRETKQSLNTYWTSIWMITQLECLPCNLIPIKYYRFVYQIMNELTFLTNRIQFPVLTRKILWCLIIKWSIALRCCIFTLQIQFI